MYYYDQACRPEVVQELCESWQVALIDPVWGRNDVLWPVLARFAAASAPGSDANVWAAKSPDATLAI
jgi:hypothetical protein